MSAPITVALVEDDDAVRERVVRVIRASPDLDLPMAAATATELLAWFHDHRVDVLLVDLGLPDLPGLEVIAECVRMQPNCAVMVLTMFGDEANMLTAFQAGARGYLLKGGTEEDLAAHVQALHAGGSPLSPLIARQMLVRWQNDLHKAQHSALAAAAAPAPAAPAADAEHLSPREMQVLDLIARGFTYAEIGGQMQVSLTTVQTHVRNVYAKLGVHSKTEAVFEARQSGLLR